MADLRDQLLALGDPGERLWRRLRSGEQVLWIGRPHRTSYSLLRAWMLTRYVLIASVLALLLGNVPLFVAGGLGISAVLTFVLIRSELRSTVYVATQSRLLVYRRIYLLLNGLNGIGANGIKVYDKDNINTITYYKHGADGLSLFIHTDPVYLKDGVRVYRIKTLWGLLSNTYIVNHFLVAAPAYDIERWASSGPQPHDREEIAAGSP